MSRVRRPEPRGQTLVEFAIILPVFILVLLGIFDLGRAIYAFNTVNNAAREAGREAIVDQTDAHIRARAVEGASSLAVAPADIYIDYRSPATPNTEHSCDAAVGTDAVVGCFAVVRVPYRYTAATPVIGNLVGVLNLAGETKFPVQFNCREPDKPSCPLGN